MIDPSPTRRAVVQGLRWMAVLPAAVLAVFAVPFLFTLVHSITAARFIDTDSWLNRAFTIYMSGAVSGASGVYVAAWLAPTYRKVVAVAVALVLILSAGWWLVEALMVGNLWSVASCASTGLGAGAIAYTVFQDQIEHLR